MAKSLTELVQIPLGVVHESPVLFIYHFDDLRK
jgi:hypothetical protein